MNAHDLAAEIKRSIEGASPQNNLALEGREGQGGVQPERRSGSILNWKMPIVQGRKRFSTACTYWTDLHSAESVQTEETMALLCYARCFNLMCLPDISAC